MDDEKVEYHQAVHDFETGALKSAEHGFKRFMQEYPNSDLADNALYQLGMIYCMTDRKSEGLDTFQRCVQNYGGTDAAPLAAEQAQIVVDEIAHDDAAHARKLFHEGRDLAGKRDFEGAKKIFLRCLEEHPNTVLADNVYLSLSMIFSLEGLFSEARRMLELILEKFPNSDAARSVPAALRRLEMDEKYQ